MTPTCPTVLDLTPLVPVSCAVSGAVCVCAMFAYLALCAYLGRSP